MCANYFPPSPEQLRQHFGVDYPAAQVVPDTYPGYLAPIIRSVHGQPEADECIAACFGMVPYWAELKLSKQTYNARTETVASKPSFRAAFAKRQFCIIPAGAFYEPNYESGKAVRWKIAHSKGRPLGMAGIWEWRSNGPDNAPLVSFSMLTINADDHALMQRFHKPGTEKRMPVILTPQQYQAWLHATKGNADSFFVPYPAEQLIAVAAPKPPSEKSRGSDMARAE